MSLFNSQLPLSNPPTLSAHCTTKATKQQTLFGIIHQEIENFFPPPPKSPLFSLFSPSSFNLAAFLLPFLNETFSVATEKTKKRK
jgi:hypothetical protein